MSDSFEVMDTPPANDDLADALEIPTNGGLMPITQLIGATWEPGEEQRFWSGVWAAGSAWWHWKPPLSTIATLVAPTNVIVRVFGGSDLVPVLSTVQGTRTRFQVSQGTDYWIGMGLQSSAPEPAPTQFIVYPGRDPGSPPNDDYDQRTPLTGSTVASAEIAEATAEPLEASLGMSGLSVWWSWTAPAEGMVRMEAVNPHEITGGYFSSPAQFQIAVFRGDQLDHLVPIQNEASEWRERYFSARVAAGDVLVVRGGTGWYALPRERLQLRVEFLNAPRNDAFEQGKTLSGLPIFETAHVLAPWASSEPGEPLPKGWWSGSRTLWWRWTSPISGVVGCAAHCFAGSGRLTVYTGDSLNSLTPVPGATNEPGLFLLQAERGQTYHLQVATSMDTDVSLHLSEGDANDLLVNAVDVPWQPGVIAANNLLATHEPGENPMLPGPPPFYFLQLSGSLWWRWTAPCDGVLALRHWPYLWVIVREWRGQSADRLKQIRGHYLQDQSWTTERLSVDSGETYLISVDTLGDTFTGQPEEQSVLLDYDFTSLKLYLPANSSGYTTNAPVPIRLAPILSEYDGTINEVSFLFRKQLAAGSWTEDFYPARWLQTLCDGPPFEYLVTNWPAGTYEVIARAVNEKGQLRESDPRVFSIAPPNDLFAMRPTVSTAFSSVYVSCETLAGSSLEEFEKGIFPAEVQGSVLWQWKAKWPGPVTVRATPQVAVFRGTDPAHLTSVGTMAECGYTFSAQRGEFYQIALLRLSADTNTAPLSFTIEPAPQNDDFEKRLPVNLSEGVPVPSENEFYYYTDHATI